MFKRSIARPHSRFELDAPASGFTLLELSVVLMIIGLMLGTFATSFNQYLQQKRIDTTNKRTDEVVAKMYEFRNANGHFPCPASVNAPRDSALYGKEADCTVAPTGGGSFDFAQGVTTLSSVRTGATSDVIVGAIPFRSLNLPEDEAYDAYGSRIVVAVTRKLTKASTFRESQGAISIKNDKGKDVFTPEASGQFAIISPGKNRHGAYTKDGKFFTDCNGLTADDRNCGFTMGSVTTAEFDTHPYADTSDQSKYFDDVIKFDPGGVKEAWRWQGTQSDMVNMAANKVLLGTRDALDNTPVSGALNILANSSNSAFDGSMNVRGDLQATKICDPKNPAICFYSKDLGIKCDQPGEYFVGYKEGKPYCQKIYYGCDSGYYLKGIDSLGAPICSQIYDGVCGSSNANNFYNQPGLGSRCTDNRADPTNSDPVTNVNFDGDDTWTWACKGSPGGTKDNTCYAKLKIDAVCGSASGQKLTTKPTSDLCAKGNASGVSGTVPPFSWTCYGRNGGNNAPCGSNMPDPIVGQCGSSENTCLSGDLLNTADDATNYNWSCTGSYGGGTASCNLPKAVLENGVCGATLNACTSGDLNDTADDNTNYNWSCNGKNGGSSTTCSLVKPPVQACTPGPVDAVNGSCGSSTNSCNSGSLSDTADSSAYYKWSCLGSDGGSSVNCTRAKPVTPPVVEPPVEPSTPQPVDGACGSYVGGCSSGTASGFNWYCVGLGQGSSQWACKGLYGGKTVGCSSPKPECDKSSF